MSIGTRIDSSYAVRLSMSPCSPKAKPLSPMYSTNVDSSSPRTLQMFEQSVDTFVDGQQSLAVPLVVFADVQRAVIRKVDAMPAVALVLHPHGSQCLLARRRVPGRRPLETLVGVAALVSRCRDEICMHRFVRQAQIERSFAGSLSEPLQRVVGELVGDVALLRDAHAIDVETGLARQISALTGKLTSDRKPRCGESFSRSPATSPPMCHLPMKAVS
jgi:hypothetical protein